MDTVNIYDLKINSNNFADVYEELIEFAKNPDFKQTYLLKTSPDIDNDENRNFIEKFVFDTASFHISEYNKKKNTSININEIYIEFWSLNDNHFKRMHFDKDEQDYLINKNHTTYNGPFLSCITYLNDNTCAPTLITDISRKFGSDDEREDFYSGKHTNFGMIFPKKLKQLTFNGGEYLHGMYLLDPSCSNRLVLPINFWFKKPKYLSYFPYYSYLKSSYSKQQIVSICKKHGYIDHTAQLFNYNKININKVMKTIEIKIEKTNIDEFNEWYKCLIFGDKSVDLLYLNEYISNRDYVYNFKFIFM